VLIPEGIYPPAPIHSGILCELAFVINNDDIQPLLPLGAVALAGPAHAGASGPSLSLKTEIQRPELNKQKMYRLEIKDDRLYSWLTITSTDKQSTQSARPFLHSFELGPLPPYPQASMSPPPFVPGPSLLLTSLAVRNLITPHLLGNEEPVLPSLQYSISSAPLAA
jgi:hypothetical protein